MKIRLLSILVLLAPLVVAQEVQVSKNNKTITISAQDYVEVPAEIAVLSIGWKESAATKDNLYRDAAAASHRILQSLLALGIKREDIQQENLSLGSYRCQSVKSENGELEFLAGQSWSVIVPVSEVSRTLDAAVKAGANDIGNIQWDVKDPGLLEAQAIDRATFKAKLTADKLAKSLGVSVGEVLYTSNSGLEPSGGVYRVSRGYVGGAELAKDSSLEVAAHKVRKDVTVSVVYAIQ